MTSPSMLEGLVGSLPTAFLDRFAPMRHSSAHFPLEDVLNILRPYAHLPAPLSMRVTSVVELAMHAAVAYTIANAHDELARREKWERFPRRYCTTASVGVMLSLFAHGYPNALVLRAAAPRDHSYVGLPYVMGKKCGVLIIDPTAGQMDGHGESVIVQHKRGETWEYRPGWKRGIDLYPDGALDHARMRTHTNAARTTAMTVEVRPLPFSKMPYGDAPTYLRAAYANPIDLGSRMGEILKNLITG